MNRDITMEKARPCSACGKKMYHGYKAVEIRNAKGKVKAYACCDACSQKVMTNAKQSF